MSEGGCGRLSPDEVEFLLGLFPCDKPSPGECGHADQPAEQDFSTLFPRVRRQGAQGLGLSVSEAAHLWRARLDRLFAKEMDLSPGQWVVLWVLASKGGETGKRRLAGELGVSEQELDADLSGLVRRGLVKLLDAEAPGAEAGPAVCLGDYSSLQRVLRLSRQLRDDALEGITEDEVAAMHATLLKILDNLRAMSGRLSAPQAPRSS